MCVFVCVCMFMCVCVCVLHCTRAGASHGAATTALAAVAAEALALSPCLLLLDDLDRLCPSAAVRGGEEPGVGAWGCWGRGEGGREKVGDTAEGVEGMGKRAE